MSTPEDPADPKKKGSLTGAGIALVVIGVLILVPSGLCTGLLGIFGIGEAVSTGNWNNFWNDLASDFMIPLFFVVIGGALLWAGLQQRKKK
jgi:hypothetical protein